MKAAMVVGVVVALHVVAASMVFLSPGCRSPEPRPPEIGDMPMPEPVTITPVPERPAPPRERVRPPVTPERPVIDIEYKEYVVKSGDVLSRIAVRTGVSLAEVMELNKLSDPDKIYVGQTLLLPPHAQLDAPAPQPREDRPARPVPEDGVHHEVQPGEALSVIAQHYGVTVQAIVKANNLRNADTIMAGQKLLIPGADRQIPRSDVRDRRPAPVVPQERTPVAPKPEPEFTEQETRVRDVVVPEVDDEMTALIERSSDEMVHVVDQGQTLEDIAGMYGVRAEDIQRANALASRHVTTGQTLKIPRD